MKRLDLVLCLLALPDPQALTQQGDSIIDWLTSLQNIEARLRGNGGDSNVASDLRSLQREIVHWSANQSDGGVVAPAVPAGGLGHQELVDYAANLQFSANYTYLSRRNQTMPSIIMLDTPRHKTYSTATYRLSDRFTVLADLIYEGGRWNSNDAGRILRASSYAAVGLGGTARVYRGAELQAGVGNLFDRNYFLVQGYPEAGRNFYVNLRYRF